MTTLPNVIGLAGQQGSGKDTAALWFVERGYAKSSFAAPIKQMLNDAFGWSMRDWDDRAWKEGFVGDVLDSSYMHSRSLSPRSLAQWLGTDVVRKNFGDDAWVNLWKQRWHDAGQPRVVISDIRFQNEVDAVHKVGGIVLRISRKGDRSGETFYDNDHDVVAAPHESERTGELVHIAHHIANDGTIGDMYEELRRRFA